MAAMISATGYCTKLSNACCGGMSQDLLLQDTGGFGTCESLEKEYLRLTSLPSASTVRPPHILGMALRLVKAKWWVVQSV